jgi:hypothetical protein
MASGLPHPVAVDRYFGTLSTGSQMTLVDLSTRFSNRWNSNGIGIAQVFWLGPFRSTDSILRLSPRSDAEFLGLSALNFTHY